MEFEVSLLEDQKIIAATAGGEWRREEDLALVKQIFEAVQLSGYRKVLMDIRELKYALPFIQLYERAEELREQRQQYSVVSTSVAIVYSLHAIETASDRAFFETAALNRGLPYRMFGDIDQAMAWLQEEN